MTRMIRRIAPTAAVAVLASLALFVPAAMAQYAAPPTVQVSDTTPGPGETIDLTGGNALVGSTVVATLLTNEDKPAPKAKQVVGTTTVVDEGDGDDCGVWSMQITIPKDIDDMNPVLQLQVVDCDGNPQVLNTQLTIDPNDADIAFTGQNSLPIAQIGATALAAGGVLVVLASRRRRVTADGAVEA